MSEGATSKEQAHQLEGGRAPAQEGSHDLFRDVFLANPSALLLFDAATLQLTDCNHQAAALLLPERTGPGLPRLTDCLCFADPASFAQFCAAPAESGTESQPQARTGPQPGASIELRATLTGRGAGAGEVSLALKRLPAAHGNLCQAVLHPCPAASAVATSDQVYAAIFAHVGIGLTVIDPSMRLLSMNPTIRAWFPQVELEGKPFCYESFNSPPRETPCSYCPAVQVLQDGQPHYATTATPTPDGVRNYSMVATPVFAADGSISCVIETAQDVTDQLRLEQEAAEKSRNLQAVLDNAPIAIWHKGVDGRFRFVNRTFCRQMGITEEQFLAAGHFSDLLAPDIAAGCARSDRECLAQEEPHLSREEFRFADGKPHLLSVTKARVTGDGGELLGVVGLGVDITEQQLSAARLQLLTESFLRFGPDFDANINVLTEVTGKILGASCTLFSLLEDGMLCSIGQWQTPADFRAVDRPDGHICYDLIKRSERDVRVIRDLSATPYATTDPNILAYGLRSYVGVPVCWGEQTIGVLCALFVDDFEPSAADLSLMILVGAALGIEEARRRSERAQLSSEKRYHALFSEAGEGVFIMSGQGVLLEVNQAFAAMHGYSAQQMSGMDLSHLDTPESTRLAPERMRRLLSGEHLTFEVEHYHRDGHTFQLEVSASLIDYGAEPNIICFHRDITERKEQEAALRKSEHEFRALADAIPQLVWICGADGSNSFVNDQWVSYTGLTRRESAGAGWRAAFHPEDRQTAWEAWQRAVQGGGAYALESRLRGADGEYRWWLVRGVPIRDEGGSVLKWFGTCTDVDDFKKAEQERRSLEKQFQQAQKLESLGVLAGGIAHDFNNILSIISGYCSLLKFEQERCADYLPEMERAVERAAELCRQMLAYAGKTKFVRTRIDLVVLMKDMVKMLQATLGQNVTLRLNHSAGLLTLTGDAGQIRQVVMNLIINASEAIGELQGEILVTLERRHFDAGSAATDHLGKGIAPGHYACLEVTDNGCGMDEETRQRIFEPFFSTKFSGRGLGMSAVLGIINSHGGALQLDSGPGLGTRFRIYLPDLEIEGCGVGELGGPAPPAPWRGHGRVLLVEDEPMVRGLAATMLQRLGFEVVEAANGEEGLQRYQEGAGGFRLVVTDLGMPVMDGYQMLRKLKQLDAALPVIITTGFGDVDVNTKVAGEDIAGFLGKPYNFTRLAEEVRRVMDPDAAG
jgi:PAS domain S-box-containing protein